LLHFICDEDDEDEEESMTRVPPELLEISLYSGTSSLHARFLLEWLFRAYLNPTLYFIFGGGNEPI
jgi:hypothetical protein